VTYSRYSAYSSNQFADIFGGEYQEEEYRQPETEENFKTYQVKGLEQRVIRKDNTAEFY
jgi:hypothetical protein